MPFAFLPFLYMNGLLARSVLLILPSCPFASPPRPPPPFSFSSHNYPCSYVYFPLPFLSLYHTPFNRGLSLFTLSSHSPLSSRSSFLPFPLFHPNLILILIVILFLLNSKPGTCSFDLIPIPQHSSFFLQHTHSHTHALLQHHSPCSHTFNYIQYPASLSALVGVSSLQFSPFSSTVSHLYQLPPASLPPPALGTGQSHTNALTFFISFFLSFFPTSLLLFVCELTSPYSLSFLPSSPLFHLPRAVTPFILLIQQQQG